MGTHYFFHREDLKMTKMAKNGPLAKNSKWKSKNMIFGSWKMVIKGSSDYPTRRLGQGMVVFWYTFELAIIFHLNVRRFSRPFPFAFPWLLTWYVEISLTLVLHKVSMDRVHIWWLNIPIYTVFGPWVSAPECRGSAWTRYHSYMS